MVEAALISTATAAAKAMAQLVADRALDESKLAWGFKGELKKLKGKFEYIQAFLEDASNSKYATRSQLVDLWVQKVKNAAYMADNVIDVYEIEIFRRKMELKKPIGRFLDFFTPNNPALFHMRMAHKVKKILSLFDEIDKDAKDIGLNRVDIAAASVTHTSRYDHDLNQTRQYPFTSDAKYVGREQEQSDLLKFMCNQLNKDRLLSTVAIVGMGGMGKTTLARLLYQHKDVDDHFGKKIWLSVTKDFDVITLLNKMIESLTSKNPGLSTTDAIIRELQKELKGKKLLLVLDDVWNVNKSLWDSIEGVLNKTAIASGSVILTTTRGVEVAQAAGAVFIRKLEGLSTDESWSLLCQIVFTDSTRHRSPQLEEIGRRIAFQKCNGVPLAIKVIGGLLKLKPDYEWLKIESSEIWDLPQGKQDILPSLLLSFNHLPSPSLKQCFAYCGLLNKGSYMHKSVLIGFWLSQGYLHDSGNRNMTTMEIGEEYLNVLLSNSLLEVSNSVWYKMHDLIIDLAVFVCGKELILDAKELRESGVRCRHLRYRCVENTIETDFPPVESLKGLRTILFIGPSVPLQLLIHTRDLRTLRLDRTGISEVPQVISELKQLRYLDLSYNPISTLPEFIGKLYQLQTLILQVCRNMKKLPKVVNQLVNLRHISTTAPKFACKGLQKLTNLQTLPCLSLNNDEEGWKIDELGHLRDLRDGIHIRGLECVKDKEQAERADIAGKTNVLNLTLRWVEGREEYLAGIPVASINNSDSFSDGDILEGLEPHANIASLEVHNFMGLQFPAWIKEMVVRTGGQLNNLTKIKLLGCYQCQTLPKLGQLPSLKCLIISGLCVDSIGMEFYGGDLLEVVSFKCLEELEISGFSRLITWMQPPKAAFPNLKTLRINYCSLLKSVPSLETGSLVTLQLENLNSIESLDIIKCSSGLTSFIMYRLPKIVSLPEELANCTKLQTLHVRGCHKLSRMPDGLESLVCLKSISVSLCEVIEFVMDDLLPLRSSLRSFRIFGCPRFRKIPNGLGECSLLESLWLHMCPMIEGSATEISKLRQLKDLRIKYSSAEHLRSVLESAKGHRHLECVTIEGFVNDVEMENYFSDITPFRCLPSLTQLVLRGQPNIKTLPEQLGYLTQITCLIIRQFDNLERIPEWIFNNSSLSNLYLSRCKNLKYLPSKEVLKILHYLEIYDCPLLARRCTKDVGPEWQNISLIEEIEIDNVVIQAPFKEY